MRDDKSAEIGGIIGKGIRITQRKPTPATIY
jgi:hypothetical protein